MLKYFNRKSTLDKSLYKVLYNTYKEKVYKIAFSILKNEHDSKDVLQDTFIKVIDNIDKLKDKNKFDKWIKAIAYNTAKMKYNKNKKELPVDNSSYIDFVSNHIDLQLPEKLLEQKEFNGFMMEQINSLNNQYNEVISLYYYSELTYQEISECLDVSIGTVKSRLYRAKQILREKLVTSEYNKYCNKSEVISYEKQRQAR